MTTVGRQGGIKGAGGYARRTCRKYRTIMGPLHGAGVGLLREPNGPRTSLGNPQGPSKVGSRRSLFGWVGH